MSKNFPHNYQSMSFHIKSVEKENCKEFFCELNLSFNISKNLSSMLAMIGIFCLILCCMLDQQWNLLAVTV